MKKSNILVLLLVLAMIFTVSAVGAADTADSSDSAVLAVDEVAIDDAVASEVDDVASAEVDEASDDVEVLEATDDTEPVADPGDGNNFTSLQSQINSENIVSLDKDYTRVEGDSVISIEKTVTILGNDHKIDAAGLGGIFKVTSNGALTLMGVTLVNGQSDKGGAIYNEGELAINDCVFTDNKASGDGGAIYNLAKLKKCDLSTFTNNQASNGAAIYTTADTKISDSTFDGNIAVNKGGAVYTNAALTVENSIFLNNQITKNSYANGGAAIFNLGNQLTVRGSQFTNNTAPWKGSTGAVSSWSTGTVLIRDSYFTLNSARFGGAIEFENLNQNDVAVENCTFYKNTAYSGGAININEGASYVNINNCTFDENNFVGPAGSPTTGATGGAISAGVNVPVTLVLTNSIIKNNYGDDSVNSSGAGVRLADYATGVISGCTFENNHNGNAGSAINVGTIFASANTGTLTVTDSSFKDNDGEGIFINPGIETSVENSVFEGNAADYDIYNLGTLELSANVLPNGVFSAGEVASAINVTILNGGTFDIYNGTYDVTATITDDNGNSIMNATGFTFVTDGANVSAVYGDDGLYHGLLVLPAPGIYTVNITYVDEDKLNIKTATINNFKGTFKDLNDKVAQGSFDLDYDFIYTEELGDNLFINGIVISDDVVINGNGFVIDAKGLARIFNVTNAARLDLINVTLINGIADYGGAVYVDTGAKLVANHVAFNDNTATYRGGAVWSAGTVIVDYSSFDSNNITYRARNVDNGGAAIFSKGELNVDHSVFTNDLVGYVVRTGDHNSPQLIDGAILSAGVSVIKNSYFENNTGTYGGAITAVPTDSTYTELTVENCEFVNNLAYNGAAINVNTDSNGRSTVYSINNCTFIGNIATGVGSTGSSSAGGAIFISRDTEGSVTNSRFYNNTATMGGAIDISASKSSLKATIDNCVFENNTAVGADGIDAIGGAIRIGSKNVGADKMVVSVENSNFTNNVAAYGGSAIYNDGTLSLSGNKVTSGETEIVVSSRASIVTNLTATLIDAQEIPTSLGETVYPYATLTDDAGNAVFDPDFKIVVDNNEIETSYDGEKYTAEYIIASVGDNVVTTLFNASNVINGVYKADKANVILTVNGSDIVIGENETIIVSVVGLNDTGLNTTVTVVVDDKDYTVEITDGVGILNVTGLEAGTHSVLAIFMEDSSYHTAYGSDTIYVKAESVLVVGGVSDAYDYGSDVTIEFILFDMNTGDNITGIIYVTVANETQKVLINDGYGSLTLSALDTGSYNITSYYYGDNVYNATEGNAESFIVKEISEFNATIAGTYPEATITIEGPDGNYTVFIDDEHSYDVVVSGGVGTETISIGAGDYVANVTFIGSDAFSAASKTVNFTVEKAAAPEFNVTVNAGTYPCNVTITVNSDVNGTAIVEVNDDKGEYFVSYEIKNGETITIPDLAVGKYYVTVWYDAGDNYTQGDNITDFTVEKGDINFTFEVGAADFPDALPVTITTDVAGNVTVMFDDLYTVEVPAGTTTIYVPNLTAGEHSGIIIFDAGANYNAIDDTITAVIGKGAPEITAEVTIDNPVYPGSINVTITGPDGEYNITVGTQIVPVTVTGRSAIAVISDVAAGTQTATVDFAGNDNYNASSVTTESFTIIKETPDIKAEAENVWIGSDATVIVTVPADAQGQVTISVNGKKYTADIDAGSATATISADDLVVGENAIDVTFAGDNNYAPNFDSTSVSVLDGVITNATYKYYFDASGNLVDIVPNNVTLDFQGLFLGKYPVYINKAVNVISSTGDALFDCGASYAGNAVNSFNMIAGSDNSNITGLKFINYCLYIKGASYITVDSVSIVANKRSVGSGTGFLSIHTGAYHTLVKNGYFENGGTGSSLLVLGKGGAYAVFDHNVFNITGSSGNILSANQFVGTGNSPEHVSYTNNVLYNNQPGSAFCYAMTVSGSGNLVENNTIYHNGSGILNQYGASSTGNVYRNNTLYGNTNFNPSANSIVENNKIYATTNIAANTVVIGNEFTTVTIGGANVNFTDNTLTGTLTVNANGNTITNNVITTTGNYAVDLKAKTGNTVTDNTLIANGKYGDVAVTYSNENNVVENNTPLAAIEIEANNVWVGNAQTITVTIVNGTGSVTIKVNDKNYTIDLVDGVASQEFAAEDLVLGENSVEVTYNGGSFIPANATATFTVLDGIITNDTFFEYFDESGNLIDAVPAGVTLTVLGTISDKPGMFINKGVALVGENAILNNIRIVLNAEGIVLDNMTLFATTGLGDLIGVYANGITVSNMDISYIVGNEEAIAINVIGVEDANIINNTIIFESHAAKDGTYANAINLEGVSGSIVDNNAIASSLTGVDADYGRSGLYYTYGMMGVNTVNPIRIVTCEDITFTNNDVSSSLNDIKGYYPTVQAVLVVGSTDLVFDHNNFTMNDTFTPAGSPSYLYAFTFGVDEGITVSNNNFYLETQGGKNGDGTAYALQIVSATMDIISNNITSVSNGPNLGIYAVLEYNTFDNDFYLNIKDNNINITGYATGTSSSALVSGMEIGAGESDISGNTIHVYNKAGYVEKANVYGISYIQSVYMPTLNIVDNDVFVEDGDYAVAVNIKRGVTLTVTDNYLAAHNRYGDKAVTTKVADPVIANNTPLAEITIDAKDGFVGAENIVTVTIPNAVGNVTITVNSEDHVVELVDGVATYTVSDVILGVNNVTATYDGISYNLASKNATFIGLDNIVTNDTFFKYFGENGVLLSTVPFDELIFSGEFADLGIDTINIPRAIKITGDEAVLTDIGLYVEAEDVKVSSIKLDYTAPSDANAYGIYVSDANGFELTDSEIKLTGNVDNYDGYQYALRIADSDDVVISDNVFDVALPARDVDWMSAGIDQDHVLAIGIQNGENVKITRNTINNNVIGQTAYTTLDTLMVSGTQNIEISYNNISQIDAASTAVGYYNVVDLYSFTGTVEYNNIIVNTTTGAVGSGSAYPIQMNGPFTATVSYNNLTAISNGPTAGIMTANWAGEADLTLTFNNIDVTGSTGSGDWDLTTGIELQVNTAKVYNNTVIAKSVSGYGDDYNLYGIGYSQGKVANTFDIQDNTVISEGKYAVYVKYASDSTVKGNYLFAHDLYGDDAVSIPSGNTVESNYPAQLNLSASADDIKVGKDAVINITANKFFTGDVTVIVNGEEKTVSLTNGIGSLTVSNLPAANYTVVVSYAGDVKYIADETNATFEVSKNTPSEMTITVGDVAIDTPVEVTVTLPGITGEVTVIVDGNSATVNLVDGVGTCTIPKEMVTEGDHSIVAVFEGDAAYDATFATGNFTVTKAEEYEFDANLSIDEANYSEPISVNVTLPEDANGRIIISVDGEEVGYADVVNGTATIDSIGNLPGGKHNLTLTYTDDKYGEKSVSKEITIDKLPSDLSATAADIAIGDDAVINVVLPTYTNGTVKVELLGVTYDVTIDSGKGTATIKGLGEGTYTAKVTFENDGGYLDNATEVTFKVTKVIIPAEDTFNMTTPENATSPVFTVNLPKDATGYLLVDVNGNKTFTPVVNGTASVPVPKLDPGNYTATVTYTGDDKYDPITTEQNITVSSNVPDTALTIPENATTSSPTYSVNLPSDATGYLVVDVDGKKYAEPLVNGSATVSVPGLANGKHNVTVLYTGDDKYSKVSKSTTLDVNVPAPVYKIKNNKNVKAIYSANAYYKVLVTKDGKALAGVKVTFKYNGKTYTRTTDKKGYASLKLNTKVKVKKYTITATYKGVKVSNKVTIQHVIKAKNMNVKKSKKVTKVKVTLKKVNKKYLKGKKITIKFKGKKYKVKTNKKGVATWKVKKSMVKGLKVGKKYKYYVTYGKDKVTKKLTIKK